MKIRWLGQGGFLVRDNAETTEILVDPYLSNSVQALDENKYDILIEVDGGINFETAVLAGASGVDVLVAGTSVFRAENSDDAIQKLRDYSEGRTGK